MILFGPKFRISDRIVAHVHHEDGYDYAQISSQGDHLIQLVDNATVDEVSPISGQIKKSYNLIEASDWVTCHAIDFLDKFVDEQNKEEDDAT